MRDNIVCGSLSNAMTIVERLLLEGYQVLVTKDCGSIYMIDYTKEIMGGSFEYVGEDEYIAKYETESTPAAVKVPTLRVISVEEDDG